MQMTVPEGKQRRSRAPRPPPAPPRPRAPAPRRRRRAMAPRVVHNGSKGRNATGSRAARGADCGRGAAARRGRVDFEINTHHPAKEDAGCDPLSPSSRPPYVHHALLRRLSAHSLLRRLSAHSLLRRLSAHSLLRRLSAQCILFCDGCQRNSFPSAMVVSAVHSLLRWLSAQCIPFPAHSRSALTDAWGAQGVARRAHAGAVRPRRFPRVPQGVALTYTLTPPPFSLPPTACPTGPNPRVPQGAALRPRRRRARRNRRARLARNAVAGRGCRRGHRVIPLGP